MRSNFVIECTRPQLHILVVDFAIDYSSVTLNDANYTFNKLS